jgi:hypothetical protein
MVTIFGFFSDLQDVTFRQIAFGELHPPYFCASSIIGALWRNSADLPYGTLYRTGPDCPEAIAKVGLARLTAQELRNFEPYSAFCFALWT